MTKLILFNGPPRSGKDTAADYVANCIMHLPAMGYRPFQAKMAESLKLTAHTMFGEDGTPADHFEKTKDEPRIEFYGHTPRQVYIDLSEEFVKRKYGEDFWAKIFIHRVEKRIRAIGEHRTPLIICSDIGFDIEVLTLAKHYGVENILLVCIERNNCTYANDSRKYVEAPGVARLTTYNENLVEFKSTIFEQVRDWLETGKLARKAAYA